MQLTQTLEFRLQQYDKFHFVAEAQPKLQFEIGLI